MLTGDSLGFSARAGRASLFPRYNRAGIARQLESVRGLLRWDFLHVLPGHGRRIHVRDAEHRQALIDELSAAEVTT